MSQKHRNDPDSPECQQMQRENENAVRTAQMMHAKESECEACEGTGIDEQDPLGECCSCSGTGRKP
jgi:hypothetical protein